MHARYGPLFSHYADFGDSAPMVPARTSVLAIVALVFAVPCFITGPIGLILGGLAILLIALSGGRVRGVGLAVAATVLGLVGTLIQVVVVWGGVQGVQAIVAPASTVMRATEAGDVSAAQGEFMLGVRPMVTQDAVDRFRDAYQAQLGSFVSAPSGILEYFERAGSLGPAWNAYGSGTSTRQNEIPIPCEFSNGQALVLLAMPQRNMGNPQSFPLSDVGIALPDGTDVWLIGGSAPNQDGQPLGATPPATPTSPTNPAPAPPASAPPPAEGDAGEASDPSAGGP